MSRCYTTSHSDKEYYGLVNDAATCYLNSVLQVLFRTKDFREAVRISEGPQHIDCQLNALFDELENKKAYTNNIRTMLKINTAFGQGDAAECFEKILSVTSPKASQIFQGKLKHKNKCCICNTETATDDPFWTLPLDLMKSDYSVKDAITKHFSPLVAKVPNQLYCDRCSNKTDATIETEMSHHPEVLTLLLKRFKFDHCRRDYVKITCRVEIPNTLQIPENQIYELYAFVEHYGELRSGHYTVTIKPKNDDRWYIFNDTHVTPLRCQQYQQENINKSSSAYLLFYRKMPAADTLTSVDISGFSAAEGTTKEKHEKALNIRETDNGEVAKHKQMMSKNPYQKKNQKKNKRDSEHLQKREESHKDCGEDQDNVQDTQMKRGGRQSGQRNLMKRGDFKGSVSQDDDNSGISMQKDQKLQQKPVELYCDKFKEHEERGKMQVNRDHQNSQGDHNNQQTEEQT